MKRDWEKTIHPSLTGCAKRDWQSQIKELKRFKIDEIALILESFSKTERPLIYEALEGSPVKRIPLVHLKNDMDRQEIAYLRARFQSRYFTIHEDSFKVIEKWRGHYRYLFLELNFDNHIAESVALDKIGGLCVDLSHFKAAEERWSEEFEYTIQKRKNKSIFACNHLSGYSPASRRDEHNPKTKADFAYLKTLPDFLFGEAIAIEINNPIKEQLKFKKEIVKLLSGRA